MRYFFLSIFGFFILLGYTQNLQPVFFEKAVRLFPNVRDLAVSPNGDELVFTAQNVVKDRSVLIHMKKQNNSWKNPVILRFSGKHFDLEPFFSNDGLRLFFVSDRPLDSQSNDKKDFDIWYVSRKSLEKPWSAPVNLGAPVNSKYNEFYPSLANNGNLYFTRDDTSSNTKDDLYLSHFNKGYYETPTKLPETINSDTYDYNAFIAPDESYIIFGSYQRDDSFGSGDLYISYKKDSGWTPAKNLGKPLNSKKLDYSPFIDYRTNTLYFTSERTYEYSAKDKAESLDVLLKEFDQYSNGQSRLYQINLDAVLNFD